MQNQQLTVEDVENVISTALQQLRGAPLSPEIAQATPYLSGPVNFRPVVELQENGRKKRRTAAASNWLPESCEIRIYFERLEPEIEAPSAQPPAPPTLVPPIRPSESSSRTDFRIQTPIPSAQKDFAAIERPPLGREVSRPRFNNCVWHSPTLKRPGEALSR